MFLLLFICWILFNQRITVEIVIFGLVICTALFFFMCRFMDYSLRKDLFIMSRLPGIAVYVLVLIREIIKANFTLFGFVLFKRNHSPIIVEFTTRLRTRTARAFLANSITLTPGTITVSVEGDRFRVHCYDRSLATDLSGSVFEQRLLKLEGGFDNVK